LIEAGKDWLRKRWPRIRLRTLLLAVLLFVAALPGISAIYLRVYENTLVRQTEAELVAQSAAIAAAGSALWEGSWNPDVFTSRRGDRHFYQPEEVAIDLSRDPVLPERPRPAPGGLPDLGALAMSKQLTPVIEQTVKTTLASVILLDRQGEVVSAGTVQGNLGQLPEVRSALRGQPTTVLRRSGAYHPRYSFEWLSRASALRIHHARPILVRGQVVGVVLSSRSARALFKGLYEDRGQIILGIGVIFGMLILLAGLISRGIARPIEALSAASRDVAAGHGTVPRTPTTAAVEIQQLYEDFRVMAQSITRRSRYLRDFAAAVSHEFKTPLAGITGAIELLEDHGETMSQAERKRFMGNISADSARLAQLVTRLLDLARADMARPEAGAAVDLAGAARRIADAMGTDTFAVAVAVPVGLPKAAASEATVETVLTTLLENSRQAGASSARLTGRIEADRVILTLTDNGPGIAEADRERLFEPFFTSRRAQGGTGLGLPIAQSLLSASGGRVRLADSPRGACFEVSLLLA
jgi:two-component system sensor histidine kinase ChvG